VIFVYAGGLTALAQDPAPLAFEVASVKRALVPTLPRGIDVFPGRFTSTDMPLMPLIIRAYGGPRWKIQNAPAWIGTEGFNRLDIALEYASQTTPSAALDPGVSASTPGSPPTLAVALEEQLGLKLRRERNQVEVLIVRAVERPRPEEN